MGWFEERFIEDGDRLRFDCVSCARPMFFPKSKLGKYKTCGGDCSAEKHKAAKEVRKSSCETCGVQFIPRGTQIRAGCGKYCSQQCNVKAHTAVNSKESQAKAHAAWRARHAINPIVKKGPLNPLWTGGSKAASRRQVDSGKTRIYKMNRRAKGAKRAPASIVQFLGASQKWKCVVCREKLIKFEVDHITPVFAGGTNDRTNLQLLCMPCNRKKSAKDPIKFMQSRGFLL